MEGWGEVQRWGSVSAIPLHLAPHDGAEQTRVVAIGTYPALFDPEGYTMIKQLRDECAVTGTRLVLLPDYMIERDVPTAAYHIEQSYRAAPPKPS